MFGSHHAAHSQKENTHLRSPGRLPCPAAAVGWQRLRPSRRCRAAAAWQETGPAGQRNQRRQRQAGPYRAQGEGPLLQPRRHRRCCRRLRGRSGPAGQVGQAAERAAPVAHGPGGAQAGCAAVVKVKV